MSETLTRVVGHEEAKRSLAAALTSDRLGGAFLLTGPRGVGRRLLAGELAKALNCLRPDAPQRPCGSCGPCGRIERGSYPDVLVVEPGDNASGSIGIDEVRGLLDELALAPIEGHKRVFVIDPASALTEPAQHALLKGLEEPPERALLILIAEREDELLDTVVSRCRTLRLLPLAPEQVEQVLVGRGLALPEAQARARWSGGSPGRALADDALALHKAVDEVVAQLAQGSAYRSPMELVDRLGDFVDQDGADTKLRRTRLLELLLRLTWALRDALMLQAAPDAQPLGGAASEHLAALARAPGRRLEAAVDQLVVLEEQVLQNVNPTLVLEGLVIDLGQTLAPHTAGARP